MKFPNFSESGTCSINLDCCCNVATNYAMKQVQNSACLRD